MAGPSASAVGADNPDCGGLTFREIEARIFDHSLSRPTVPQLCAYMRERQRRQAAEFTGCVVVTRPGGGAVMAGPSGNGGGADNPDCGGLTFREIEARIFDHSLSRPTVPQLCAYMRERQRRQAAEFTGYAVVTRPDRTGPDGPSGAPADRTRASDA